MVHNPYQRYQKIQDETSAGGQTIVLLYGGMLRFLGRGLDRKAAGDIIGFRDDVVRVQEILAELAASLDHAVGGDTARQLQDLYVYFAKRLTQGLTGTNDEAIGEVQRHLGDLKGAWEGAVEALAGQRKAARASA